MVSNLLTVDLGLEHLLLLLPHVLLQLQGLLEERHHTSEAAAAASPALLPLLLPLPFSSSSSTPSLPSPLHIFLHFFLHLLLQISRHLPFYLFLIRLLLPFSS